MAELPPLRRIVTGHEADGTAVVDSDTTLSAIDPRQTASPADVTDEERKMKAGGGFITIWKTDESPANIQGPWKDYHGSGAAIPLSSATGTTVRAVDMPPGMCSPMHRTVSLDFGVVLAGEVVLVLDGGREVIVRPGETVVQRGTIHAWHNRGKIMARVLFVLLPAEPVVINGEPLEKTQFGVN
ncbi:hypothetical protein SBRCBS47491_002663 [Sporothrix bragantina]|uniref:Cupin type-2 domain-containing protein n=1 Tax=Sporothrix bragantina TaxID=671064 RepID=A0ABP0B8K8_9PEZI